MTPLGLTLYRAATLAAAPALPVLLRRRLAAGKEHPTRWRERLGVTDAARPPGRLIWLHGASVGEGLSLLPLAEALLASDDARSMQAAPSLVPPPSDLIRGPSRQAPPPRPLSPSGRAGAGLGPPIASGGDEKRDGSSRAGGAAAQTGLTVLLTTGTVTSAALLAKRLPPGVVHQFAPADTPDVARRFLDHWRPSVAVFAESEIWPNLLEEARRRRVRTALISARLSKGSLSGWARFPSTARRVFGGFALVLAQDDATARGLATLGARDDGRLNLKLCGAPLPVDEQALASFKQAAGGVPILLAASTHPGEEEIVLDAFAPLADRACLAIAPRHPDRGEAVAALAAARGLRVSRQGAGQPFGEAGVHVADGLGELGLWFSLTASTLVGGSLRPGPGGHNPLEPARLGAPQLHGPHVENWRGVYALLGDAAPTVSAHTLTAAWRADLDRPDQAKARAKTAAALADTGDEALTSAAARLLALAEPAP